MKTILLTALALCLVGLPAAQASQFVGLPGYAVSVPAPDTTTDVSAASGVLPTPSVPGVPPMPWPGNPPCFHVQPATFSTPSWQGPGQDVNSPNIPGFNVLPGLELTVPSYHVPSVTYTQDMGEGEPLVVSTAEYDTPGMVLDTPEVSTPPVAGQTLVGADSVSGGSYTIVYPGSTHCVIIE